jgi:sugar phosphate isomerase/epimerase
LEDIAATRVHYHLIPGEGVIDFAATLQALQSIGYQGWITIELYTCHENPDAAARLARERILTIAQAHNIPLA